MQRSTSRSSQRSSSPPESPLYNTTGSLSNTPNPVSTRSSKIDQIIHNFYAKTAQIVVPARSTHARHRQVPPRKTNKWFNIEVDDIENKESFTPWKRASSQRSLPTFTIEVILDLSEMTNNQVLILENGDRRNRIDLHSLQNRIVIERWKVELTNHPPRIQPELPIVYKKSIILFRSLYASTLMLPAYKLHRQLWKKGKHNKALRLSCRIVASDVSTPSIVPLETQLLENETLQQYDFVPVMTPLGSISISVSYRPNCRFWVDDSETLLSSRFIDMDENYFTPTIARFPSQTNSPHATDDASKAKISTSEPQRRFHGYNDLRAKPAASTHVDESDGDAVKPIEWNKAVAEVLRLDQLKDPAFAKHERILMEKGSRSNVTSPIQPFKSPSLSSSIHSYNSGDGQPIPGRRSATNKSGRPMQNQSQSSSPGVGGADSSSSVPSNSIGKRYSSSFGYRHERGGTVSSISSSTASIFREMMFVQPDSSAGVSRCTSSTAGAVVMQPSSLSPLLNNDDDDIGAFMQMLDSRRPLSASANKKKGDTISTNSTMATLQTALSDGRVPSRDDRFMELLKFQKMRGELDDLTEDMSASTSYAMSSGVGYKNSLGKNSYDNTVLPRYGSLYAPIVSSSLAREYVHHGLSTKSKDTHRSSREDTTYDKQRRRYSLKSDTDDRIYPLQHSTTSTPSSSVPYRERSLSTERRSLRTLASTHGVLSEPFGRRLETKGSFGKDLQKNFDSLPTNYLIRERSLSPPLERPLSNTDPDRSLNSQSSSHDQRPSVATVADDDDLVFAMSDMAVGTTSSAHTSSPTAEPCHSNCALGSCTCSQLPSPHRTTDTGLRQDRFDSFRVPLDANPSAWY